MRRTNTLTILVCIFLFSNALLFSETQKASLTYFKGKILFYRNRIQIQPVLKMAVLPGDSLVTGDESSLEVTYEDGSVSSLEPNSIIKIKEIKKENGLFTTRIKTWLGRILCKVKKLRSGETFEVYTPTAVATVRGTVFEAEVTKNQETLINVVSGKVFAKSLIEGAKTYLVKESFKYTVGRKGIPIVRKLTEKEITGLRGRAKSYLRGFIEEEKTKMKENIKEKVRKGCLGFF
ncbi:MAG: hypothetical protein B5M53_00580 [Candidatus Cloacimonas sp. 4484_209]|nr:MAG: hypothetical protein B5M53_00580 [Candidatus Cloacimonas sp. 4484_209]